MAEKLAWFPFYAGTWMTDQDVLELTGEQMGAYLWLLCLQWQQGALPYEAHRVVAMSPRGIPEVAITYVLLRFFPPDPDTNERRNPKLAAIRERQLATYQVRVASIEKARKHKQVNAPVGDQDGHQVGDEDELLSFFISGSPSVVDRCLLKGDDTLAWIPASYHPDLLARLRSSHSPTSLVAELRILRTEPELRGLRGVSGEHVGQALRDAAMKGAKLTSKTLANYVRVAQSPSNGTSHGLKVSPREGRMLDILHSFNPES